MKKISIFALAALTFTMLCQIASAVTTSYIIDTGDLATGKPTFSAHHGTGNNPFGYDWDSSAPTLAAGAPTGFGSSSFYANVDQSGATPSDRYRTFRLGTRDLTGIPGSTLEIGELTSISFQTNKPLPQNAVDWRITLYTTPGDVGTDPTDALQGAGDGAKWYRSRIQAQPQSAISLNAPANTWNTWSTGVGTNQLNFFESTGVRSNSNMAWSDIVAGTTPWNYSAEEIMMIDFTLGANSGGGTSESQIDAVLLTFSNGNTVSLNFETVPEPTTFGFAALGLCAIGYIAHRRKTIAKS